MRNEFVLAFLVEVDLAVDLLAIDSGYFSSHSSVVDLYNPTVFGLNHVSL
jgi:hypothetical protein